MYPRLQHPFGGWNFRFKPGVNGHRLAQGPAQSLEGPLYDMVGVAAADLAQVEGKAGMLRKAFHKFIHQLGVKGPDLLRGDVQAVVVAAPAGDVDGASG